MVKRDTFFKKGGIALLFALGYAACALVCLFPLARTLSPAAAAERCLVTWEDGSSEELDYPAALSLLAGAEADRIVLEREGVRGEAETGAGYRESFRLLGEGSLPELLTARFGGLTRLERAALFRSAEDTAYYSADLFAFDGSRVFRTARKSFGTVVLLDGSVPASVLMQTGAKQLVVRGGAVLGASALVGTQIEAVGAEAPYAAEGGAVYLDTPGGRRLIAALPGAVRLEAAYDFCDEGALSPCTSLVSLSLPFLGSGAERDGRLVWAFAGEIPQTLVRVKVSGGEIGAFAFSGCAGVEEIDLCGVPAAAVSPSAFAACGGLLRLHTAKSLALGGFRRSRLSCGCYLYERSTL